MKKPPGKSGEREAEPAFKELLPDVTPLPAHGRVLHARARRKPIPLTQVEGGRAVVADSLSDHIAWDAGAEAGEELVYLRNGVAPQTLKKLRRGHWPIQAELDLHGLTSIEARTLLVEFLNACKHKDVRCVRIIHGKGLRSENREAVLRTKVANWLIQRDEVLAFCHARPIDGGSGAMMVLLKGGRWEAGGGRSQEL